VLIGNRAELRPGALWLRWTAATLIGLVALGGVGLFAYRIALARVPQYRAALERLVRARTGLDVRFNELGLSWGWYGPEAVFRRVELGEPGRSQMLLRAAELIVGFDVWHALHTGQLEAGRVTLVAPDIDITRLRATATRRSELTQPDRRPPWSATDLLARWPGGPVDVEDATLTVPDPAHADRTLRFAVRRARLFRSGRSLSVYAQALLPQRLGRAVSVSLELAAGPHQVASSGTLRLDGRGVQFGGLRDILRAAWPGAPYFPSAGIGNVKLHCSFADGRLDELVAEIHADEMVLERSPASAAARALPVELRSAPPLERASELPLGRIEGVFHLRELSPGRWQLATDGGEIGPFHLTELEADWTAGPRHAARLEGRADGRIEEVIAWLSHSPAQGVALAARSVTGRGRAAFRFENPDPSRPEDLRVTALVSADWLRFAPQVPPLTSVSGTLTLSSGHLLRSTLNAKWLGGATTLRLAERDRERGATALHVQAEGALDARALVAATGIDTGGARVEGRTAWTGELVWDPAGDQWHARADASFVGIASELPDPLAKPERQPAPFHIDVSGSNGSAWAQVAGENVRGAFELAARDDGIWLVREGVLSFGGGKADLDPRPGQLELRGRLDSIDLPAWLIAWRMLAAAPEALPVRADLSVGELALAGRHYADVTLTARTHGGADGGFELKLESGDLSGAVRWPKEVTPSAPVEVHLERLGVQDSGAPLALAPLLGALGTAAEVRADQILWHGRSLGTLQAHVETRAGAIVVSSLRLAGAAQDLEASVRCRSAAACRARFELTSRDAAATLRDFGFRGDVASDHALFKGDLQWPRDLAPLDQAWLASLTGSLSIELANGTIRTDPVEQGAPFALLLVPALLSDAPGAGAAGRPDEPALAFSRLSADYSLHDGSATTSDLHFDGAAEILVDGRIGVTTRDYDCRAWILQGAGRLPQALRSFVSAPRMAAAWMALRDLISGAGDSAAQLHLGGTWDAPDVRRDQSPSER
jgi:uncharacterized protein YhdP